MTEGFNHDLFNLSLKVERTEGQLRDALKDIAELVSDRKDLKHELLEKIEKLEEGMARNYVTKSEFEPIKKLVYGFVSFVLVSVLTAFMTLLWKTTGVRPGPGGTSGGS